MMGYPFADAGGDRPGQSRHRVEMDGAEMENRYRNMSKLGVRNIDGYNQRLTEARRKGRR